MSRHAHKPVVWLASGIASLACLWSAASWAAPPADQPKAQDPDPPSVQRPKSSATQPSPSPGEGSPSATEPPAGEGPPPADPDAPVEPATQPTPDAETQPTPAVGNPENDSALLAPSTSEPSSRPLARPPAPAATGISREEQSARYYDDLYRPADNPGRFNFGARALFMAAGASHSRVSGRMAGMTLEAGHTWNWIGYALTGTIYGGQTLLGDAQEHEFNFLVGGGPTLSLGRLSLIRGGYLDARVGYDFFYGATKVSAIGASDGVTSAPDNVTPHGPRLRLDMGLLMHRAGNSRWRHGLGATFGYQMLVGSLSSEMPLTNVLLVGINYFLG